MMGNAETKSPADVAEPLQGDDPEAREAATKVAPARGQQLPTLDAVACEPGKVVERVLETPIRVLVGPRRALLEVIRLEKAELGPGQKDGVRAPGQTRYICRPVDKPEAGTGTYLADELFLLDKPAPAVVAEPEPAEAPEPSAPTSETVWEATANAFKLATEYELDLATVAGTGPHGKITVADVRNALPAGAYT